MRYVCIERYRGEFPVVLMCRVLEVTRSGFHPLRLAEGWAVLETRETTP